MMDTDIFRFEDYDDVNTQVKNEAVDSLVSSFYDSKKIITERLTNRFGSDYVKEHPEEVLTMTNLLEQENIIWTALYYAKELYKE